MKPSANSLFPTESRLRSWFAAHKIALVITWLVATITTIVIVVTGQAGTNLSTAIRQILHVLYAAALLWYLARSGPAFNQLPQDNVPRTIGSKIGAWLAVLGVAIFFLLSYFSANDKGLLILFSLIAFVPILLVWGRDLSLRLIFQAFAVALFAYLAGSVWVKLGVLSKSWSSILSALTVPFYITGGLLLKRTGLGGLQLLNRGVVPALKSVCVGWVYFVPMGLFNALGDPMVDLSLIREWWMPLWLPWWSGINEEAWYRLYLVGLVYFMLRPAFYKVPGLAVIAAVLFSGIVFGVGHGPTPDHFWTTGILYGIPFAVIFAKRDWEHAVGAHYMVNMIPTLVAFLSQ
ncbi:MAG TPA: CPBP family glutamic-type intramembrane protease [Anaerolineales bacterium]